MLQPSCRHFYGKNFTRREHVWATVLVLFESSGQRYGPFLHAVMPPSTTNSAPVIYRACSESRKLTQPTTSSTPPRRLSATRFVIRARSRSERERFISVCRK